MKFSTNLKLAYVYSIRGGKKDFKGMKGLEGSFCQDSGSLNMCHHVRILGIVIWPLLGSCGRGWWTRREQREGACVSHQKTTRTGEVAFPGGTEGRGVELCNGRDTADIQQSWWSLYQWDSHYTPRACQSPWGGLEHHRARARELHQSTTVIWGKGRHSGSKTLPPIISF